MTKQEFLRVNRVNEMPKLVQVLAGRLYDATFTAGQHEGYRQGIDAVAKRDAEVHERIYQEGAKAANHFGSALFTAAACCTLHDNFGFGAQRLNRVCNGIGELLVTELTPTRLIEKCRAMGIRIDYDDPLAGELDGWEAEA